uniref:SAM domain-containing protein n=2 Tax=Tetraodon nigroviridis TaxID=99883 RepID=H3CCN0_TETNG
MESRVLTHLIEGFVIQEGAQPFPVSLDPPGSRNLSSWPRLSRPIVKRKKLYYEYIRSGFMNTNSHTESGSSVRREKLYFLSVLKGLQEPRLTCELCGKVDFASIFKRPRRFCSACAKRYSLGCTRRVALFPERRSSLEKGRSRRILSGTLRAVLLEYRRPLLLCAPALPGRRRPDCPPTGTPGSPAWPPRRRLLPKALSCRRRPAAPCRASRAGGNVEDVYEFISSLPGCLEIAEEFRSQEIDGQALLLLKEDHLMATMNIKVGPALKILAQISSLKDS